jgi:hypothetical protein
MSASIPVPTVAGLEYPASLNHGLTRECVIPLHLEKNELGV